MYINHNVENIKRVFPEQNRKLYLRLDMNENPTGLPKKFIKSVLKTITPEFLSTYPEPKEFTEKYSTFIGRNPDNVVATNGSDTAIRYLLEIFGQPGKEVLTVSPSFEMYRINCNLLGLVHKPVYYDNNLNFNINDLINFIGPNTRVVVILNPNNPIGNSFTKTDIIKILDKASENNALVIIDEAYHYFSDKTFIDELDHYDNLVILRTFSKMFSLAACRLGVIISNKHIIELVKSLKLTFDVNSFALLFGTKLIESPDVINDLKLKYEKGKKYLTNYLTEKGYIWKESDGNFILIKTNQPAQVVAHELRIKHRILVHDYSNPLLQDYIRVTVGSIKCMKQFIVALNKIEE